MKRINWIEHLLNFIAVILGVLIAFQIGSFAENAREKRELSNILHSIIKELDEDMRTYEDYQLPRNTEQIKSINKLLQSVKQSELDSINSQISAVLDLTNYSPISSTYISVVSSGKLNLIKNLNLRKDIINYYDVFAQESKKQGEVQTEFFLKEIIPWMMDNTDLITLNPKDLAGSTRFSNRLVIYQSLIGTKTKHYEETLNSGRKLKESLENYLIEID